MAVMGYLLSYLPQAFAGSSFWTSSPTFFFLRLGILVLSVPVAFFMTQWWRGELLQEFGKASLFVYWVHVELVYGVLTAPIHRRLPFPIAQIYLSLIEPPPRGKMLNALFRSPRH